MHFIRGLHNLCPEHVGCAVTIGNFDGVHLGHRALLEQLRSQARERGLAVMVMLFEPQPAEFFAPDQAPSRLLRLREKLDALRAAGVDYVLCLHFSKALADLTAQAFVEEILVQRLGARYVMVGDDFRFGKKRAGDFGFLVGQGQAHGFEVADLDTYMRGDSRVSSTRIRQALQAGDVEAAASMLGRPYCMGGHVAHGNEMGRTIGFPTLNIYIRRRSPVTGVFAVRVRGLANAPLPGVANIGFRPTVEEDRTEPLLEVHLFDFDQEVYGRFVEVDFMAHIREEMKFDSFPALQQQILQDADVARNYFAATGNNQDMAGTAQTLSTN